MKRVVMHGFTCEPLLKPVFSLEDLSRQAYRPAILPPGVALINGKLYKEVVDGRVTLSTQEVNSIGMGAVVIQYAYVPEPSKSRRKR